MEIIAAISVGIVIITFAAGISWLALRVFFFALSRGLRPVLQREGVDDRTELIQEVGRLPGMVTQ
jgi:uncharacterized membrane protein